MSKVIVSEEYVKNIISEREALLKKEAQIEKEIFNIKNCTGVSFTEVNVRGITPHTIVEQCKHLDDVHLTCDIDIEHRDCSCLNDCKKKWFGLITYYSCEHRVMSNGNIVERLKELYIQEKFIKAQLRELR